MYIGKGGTEEKEKRKSVRKCECVGTTCSAFQHDHAIHASGGETCPALLCIILFVFCCIPMFFYLTQKALIQVPYVVVSFIET
jgi:hypothetical protein